MKKLTDQSGFSAVEVVLVMVIVAIVGGVGYYVYHANNKTLDSYNAASESASQPVVKSKKSASGSSSSTTTAPKTSDANLNAAANAANPDSGSTNQDTTDANSALSAN